jgi:hypothetical protein
VKKRVSSIVLLLGLIVWGAVLLPAQGEVVLQFFNNSWNEITEKIPEIAEVGYGALWLPPPQKASGALSVGYDLWDPFDLGGQDQRGTVKTRYGTEEELLRLIETAHRFGIRVYFDNIMNHRAFDIPGYDENTAIDIYPGMVPEDFHLRVTEDGFYRKWDNTANWGSTWEVQMRNLSDLIDIAHESPNGNFGPNEGDTHPKRWLVRQPENPDYYDFHPTLGHVGFASTNITTNTLVEYEDYYKEDVGGYLCRSIRWLVDKTKVDGLRLDAVKHVPGYFFGEQWDAGKDTNSAGYCGQAQWQFNQSRGFSDANHRDTVFDTEKSWGRDDLMMFGEHMGEPPDYEDYWAAGMRLLDARTHASLNERLGNPDNSLNGLDSADFIDGVQMGQYLGVYYAKSHDDNIAYREELHNALNLTRAGLGDIYTDGNRQAETLGQSGGAFPRHANTCYLGQWGDSRIPNLVYIHNHFARSEHHGRWSDSDVIAYDRVDKRENPDMSNADGCVMSFMVNDNYSDGAYREIPTYFPEGSYLWQYSDAGGNFYTTVEDNSIKVTVPPGGYFAFSWRTPEESSLWSDGGGHPVTLYDGDGSEAGWISYVRHDGPDGDPGFNPYGVSDDNASDYAYTYFIPRVTSSTNLRFVARVDGSAYDVMFKLDGGINLNSNYHGSGDGRDYPPGNDQGFDVFLGYESADFVSRIHREKFASVNTLYNKIGSAGSDSYAFDVGTAGVTNYPSSVSNEYDNTYTASWIYHDPGSTDLYGSNQFDPAPDSITTQATLRIKVGYQNEINKLFVYYTTDGQTWPEGAGGQGQGNTQVAECFWYSDDTNEVGHTATWWTATLQGLSNGTTVRYKIGGFRQQDGSGVAWDVPFPSDYGNVSRKTQMMGTWQASGIDPENLVYYPHNDWGNTTTGLVDGFHMIRARAFLQRDGAGVGNDKRAALYNTFEQTFYLDTETPQGEIKYPGNGDWLQLNEYGAVVRCDPTVQSVWYHIVDADDANDDGQTGNDYGNGTNAAGETAWAEAYSVTPSLSIDSEYPDEYRFSYYNIPTNGNAIIYVRLLELSSSTNFSYSAQDGHYTELVITNTADAPDVDFYFDWPSENGTPVQVDWTIRLKFSSSIGDGFSDSQMIDRFLIKINDVAQGRDNYDMTRDAGGGIGQLEYDLPDLYNGDTNFLHHIAITYETAGGVTLQAHRYVTAQPVDSGPSVQITDPPAYDSDGQAYEIVLPDVASPTATQRQYRIRVETDLSAQNVWIVFTNCSGDYYRIPSSTNELTGTVSVVAGTNTLTGSGTMFDSQLGAGNQVLIGTNLVSIAQVQSSNSATLASAYPGPTASGVTAYRVDGNPAQSGSSLLWDFMWTNMTEGRFTFNANVNTNDATESQTHAYAQRSTTVLFREMVEAVTNDYDYDDDGLYNDPETTPTNLPSTNPETWNNGEVHIWYVYGKSDPLSPDTDGDGLPDGLECGWRGGGSSTDTNTDTNGDGFPNFRPDLDPPFFNTVPDNSGIPGYNFNASRTDLLKGSMTDPNNSDSDYDGIPDGLEDLNRNGWVDGDGNALQPGTSNPWDDRPSSGDWPDGVWDEYWTETDPNNSDTDLDGASDGYGEDTNFNGHIDGDLNSNRVWEAGELWTETDPLNDDTDGDSLPDGWEKTYGLNPWDDGETGHTNLYDGSIIATNDNGYYGNPDGDMIVNAGTTNAYYNYLEYQNGTNPKVFDEEGDPPEGSVTIGPGNELGSVNGVTYYEEFMEWTWDDLIVLDEYDGDGSNNQQGDVYKCYDGFDESRDMMAFYARDGGDVGSGGDGKFYFRVDFYDLAAYAEEGFLNVYVVIDTGQPESGEMGLPDDVDAMTSNRWEVLVACYESGQGRAYVDTDPVHNSSSINDSYDLASFGVEARDQNTADGFLDAYFNSELDAVEFSISRQALRDGGWNGLDADELNYQVYVTRDNTCNGCGEDGNPGDGDIGGRNDICDSIYDDDIAEDYWEAQQGIKNALGYSFGGNYQGGRAKVAMMLHGNQAIQPGNVIQDLINNNAGAGLYRPLDVHEIFSQPMTLHLTPTFASAIEWAKSGTNGPSWRDGPALNDRISQLAATSIVYLAASTFSDHMLPYFTTEFNQDNVALATEYLESLYGVTFTTNTLFWTPERLMDSDTMQKILDLGYRYTIIDQNTHLWNWFGRQDSMGDNGYRINQMNGLDCFIINNLPTDYRYSNYDSGLGMPLRRLLSRKSRSGTQDQVVSIFCGWEDFSDNDDADAYDANIRWLANRPWVAVVSYEQIMKGEIDVWGNWWRIERGTLSLDKQAHDWLNHATDGNYDNWYLGTNSLEEGLQNKIFDIRSGAPTPEAYGMLYTDGMITDTWTVVTGLTDSNVARNARGALHASVFETAFHNEDNNDLSRWSDGEYINPASSSNSLADFSKYAQSQSRMAAIYDAVDEWAAIASSVTTPQAWSEDVDLDGEDEYLLYNDRLLGIFERSGGRMIGAWVRDILNDTVYQAAGNLASYPGRETEDEGTYNTDTNEVPGAYRTSCFKDWWGNTSTYINDLYTMTDWTNGWRMVSSDGALQKTITLDEKSWNFEADYQLSGSLNGQALYIRHGLSPYLYDLLIRGQDTLGSVEETAGLLTLANTNYHTAVLATIGYADAGHNSGYNADAVDDDPGGGIEFDTVNMRNQAQTHQVELVGTNSFSFSLGFQAEPSDWDEDGMPNDWSDSYGLDTNALGGAEQDADGDGVINKHEYTAGTSPLNGSEYLFVAESENTATGMVIRFPTQLQREYRIYYADSDLTGPTWSNATPSALTGTGGTRTWTDDGSQTEPNPDQATNRFYRIRVSLPE